MGDAYSASMARVVVAGSPHPILAWILYEDWTQMNALFITGRLLLEIASAGFGVTLGFAVKNWLEQRENARRAE